MNRQSPCIKSLRPLPRMMIRGNVAITGSLLSVCLGILFVVPVSPTIETHPSAAARGTCQLRPFLTPTQACIGNERLEHNSLLRLRGGGKDPASDRFASKLGKSMAGLDFDAIGDNEEKETETEAAMLDQEGEEEVKKKTHKKKTPEPKTRAERLALIAKPTDTELESDKDLVVARVKQLQRAMQKKDKGQITAILDKVAEAARHHYGPKIWGVAPLKTDGFAFKGSMRQERLKGSTTALTKTPLSFSAEGKSVAEIREQSKALCIPNPTDQVLGIDEYTELRLALEAANETRTLPITVNNNRDLAKIAKTAIGDMLVPEDVAVRWWLTKKREERAKQKARKEAGRKQLILDHATMDFLLAKMDAESAGEVFDADKAEEKAMRKATHFYTLSRVEEKKRLLKAARASGVPLTGPLVKPKGIKRTSIVKRRGPRRALYKKPKVIKVVGKGKTPNSKGKRKLGFGSQRQKRSGVSGGSTGASRHKKRRGK